MIGDMKHSPRCWLRMRCSTQRLRIARLHAVALATLLLFQVGARAQAIVQNDETLTSSRTEAWAMNYVAASTLMTAFGGTPDLAAGRWQGALDLGHVPRLSESQQRVGRGGVKQEGLNRSPVFGRLRLVLGLPGGFVADLGYTPPLSIRGTRPRDLFALALGRRVFERDSFTVSMRAFGQHGRAQGDVTCPARLAGAGPESNPFGCRAPSDDQIVLNYYGFDATSAGSIGPWHAHATVGAVRTELVAKVDALTFDVRDRSRLVASGGWPFATVGASRDLGARWNLGAEVLYVPLRVRRDPDAGGRIEALTSLRMRLLYRFD